MWQNTIWFVSAYKLLYINVWRRELMNLSDTKCDARYLVIIIVARIYTYTQHTHTHSHRNDEWRISRKRINDKLIFFLFEAVVLLSNTTNRYPTHMCHFRCYYYCPYSIHAVHCTVYTLQCTVYSVHVNYIFLILSLFALEFHAIK